MLSLTHQPCAFVAIHKPITCREEPLHRGVQVSDVLSSVAPLQRRLEAIIVTMTPNNATIIELDGSADTDFAQIIPPLWLCR